MAIVNSVTLSEWESRPHLSHGFNDKAKSNLKIGGSKKEERIYIQKRLKSQFLARLN